MEPLTVVSNILGAVGLFCSCFQDWKLATKSPTAIYFSLAANTCYIAMNIVLGLWVMVPFNIWRYGSALRTLYYWTRKEE